MLQCVAVCCKHRPKNGRWQSEREMCRRKRVCCSALQCVAVCCSVLQFVAVSCSTLQAQTEEWKVARSGREMCRRKRVCCSVL